MRLHVLQQVALSLLALGVSSFKTRRHHAAEDSTAIDQQFSTKMEEQVGKMFNNQANDKYRSKVSVAAASAGSWLPREGCSTPKQWVFVYGQYRTFDYTMENLADMASKSSDDCYFLTAVMPDDKGTLGHIAWPAKGPDVASALSFAQQIYFGGRLAYIVVTRSGMYDRALAGREMWVPPSLSLIDENSGSLQGTLDMYWYLVAMNNNNNNARLSALVLGMKPEPTAVVVRTRSDILWHNYVVVAAAVVVSISTM
ncbi:unnamed protein product [Polarella glacialis]|uniref:Gamma-glutamylcyclotransferase n=1 Tax=Polarella glacialis TaxID=89957 RepID=A0A813D8Z4_POLGL|nr:unnamed protein product [Polarella glacialis]CAE8680687.1 unnamed protein product [Polarella glacialis]